MKAIKSFLFCAITLLPLLIQPTAKAESRPEFCQIDDGNVTQYVSRYNMFDNSAPTPLRPFLVNSRPYNVTKELAAKPLFYTALEDGSIVSAFQLRGVIGNVSIGKKDVVTQYIKHYEIGSYAEIIGHCINGVFVVPPKQEIYQTWKLPSDTQSTLQEATMGVLGERMGNLFR
ncbi:hypothetical protein [Scytonema sp. PCC 10023]|uniref:hypothetical protein n=1 Tax=Scytonema sp. PCC 10023 TaxID=1680591 RepID=UPI0039C69C76